MNKYVTVGMAGFLMGMKCRRFGKKFCMKHLRKQAMKLMRLA